MKKILVIVILMIASVNLVNAQGVSFGAKAGLNMESISGFPSGSGSMNIGFHVGGIVNIGLSDNFAVVPELLFTTAGAKYDYSMSMGTISESVSDKISLSYLQIPILAKYSLNKDEGLNFSAGIYLGFLMGASSHSTSSATIGTTTVSSDTTISSTNGMSGMDIGIALGVGYQLAGGLGFGVRYDLGLTSVFKEQTVTMYEFGIPVTTTQPAYGKNGVIQISVNYMFGSGK